MSRVNQANEDKAEEVRQALAQMVCYESVAPSKFCNESDGFKTFIAACNPSVLSFLDSTSLQQNCLKLYKQEHSKVMEVFSNLDGQISLSIDLLTYEKPGEPFHEHMCLSAHFVNDKWKLRKWVLRYCDVYGLEMKPSVVATSESIRDWNIEGKVFGVTIGGKIDTSMLKEQVQGKRVLLLNGKLFHVRCCSDMISRMVQKGFRMIDEIIDKVQAIAWSRSLPLWYLTSTKLRNALELKENGGFSRVPKRFVPTKGEWGKVKKVCKIVDQIYEITKGLFKAKMLTANLFLPCLKEIRTYLTQEANSSDPFEKSMAEKMLKTFNKYWNDMYLILAIAAFLDPRHKMKLIELSSSKVGDSDDHNEEKSAYVLQTIHRLYDDYVGPNDQPVNSELNLYLEEPVLPMTENFSVLL
ncbi:hypothetical protein RND81_05G087000 [Saponaria officinalis]